MQKTAIVTGVGRREGIGAAICRKLAEQGYDIFFTYWHNYDIKMKYNIEKNEAFLLGVRVTKQRS